MHLPPEINLPWVESFSKVIPAWQGWMRGYFGANEAHDVCLEIVAFRFCAAGGLQDYDERRG